MRQGWWNGWSGVAGLLVVAAGILCGAPRSSSGDGEVGKARRFDLSLESSLRVQKAGADSVKTLESTTHLLYDRMLRPGSLDVSIHSIEMQLKEDGREAFGTKIARAGITTRRGDAIDEEFYEKTVDRPAAVPAIRRMLETFDTTAVTVVLDDSGKELKRTPKISGPLAEKVLGSVDLLLALHPAFPAREDRWEVPAVLRMDQGRAAQGILRFEKVSASAGMVRVNVTGLLSTGPAGPKNEEARTGSYTVSGEQVYDLAQHEWKSARWSIEMAFDILHNGKTTGAANGTARLTMNPAKATASNRTTAADSKPLK